MKYSLTSFFFKFSLTIGVIAYTWFVIWYCKMFPIQTSPVILTLFLFFIIILDVIMIVWLLFTFARKIYIKNGKLVIKDFLNTRRYDIRKVVLVDTCYYKSSFTHNRGIKVYLRHSECEFGGFAAFKWQNSERITEDIVMKLNLDIDDEQRKLGLKK